MTRGQLNAKSARSMLRAVREFAKDFSEVTLSGSGMTVTVKFNEGAAREPAKKPVTKEAKTVSHIRSLQMTPPVFEGPLEGERA